MSSATIDSKQLRHLTAKERATFWREFNRYPTEESVSVTELVQALCEAREALYRVLRDPFEPDKWRSDVEAQLPMRNYEREEANA
jgi:hypothetical protein